MGCSPGSYSFTSAMGRIVVHTAPQYGQKLIPYMTLHLRSTFLCGAASFRYRNRAATIVVVCEQKPYSAWFSRWRKNYPVYIVWTPIRSGDVTLHFKDRRRAASLRHRNQATTTVLEGEQTLSAMIFLVAQKLSGIVWTYPWLLGEECAVAKPTPQTTSMVRGQLRYRSER